MRAFILALALAMPLALTACSDTPQEEAIEEGAPAGDQEDVIGDGEIIDEPGEPEGNVFTNYDTDGDGMINDTEYGDNFPGVEMTAYDSDGNGTVSQAEYDAYMTANPSTNM